MNPQNFPTHLPTQPEYLSIVMKETVTGILGGGWRPTFILMSVNPTFEKMKVFLVFAYTVFWTITPLGLVSSWWNNGIQMNLQAPRASAMLIFFKKKTFHKSKCDLRIYLSFSSIWHVYSVNHESSTWKDYFKLTEILKSSMVASI